MQKTAYCFDLDGTITAQEILPLIAQELGLYEEIYLLTDVTMKGLIPFESSFKLRVKLLSSIPLSVVQNIVGQVRLQQEVLKFIQTHSDDCYIITGNLDVWVKKLTPVLGCKVFASEAEYEGNDLKGVKKILNKGVAISEIKSSYDRVVAIGDGMNDSPMFEKADVTIAYGGVHDPVETLIDLATYVTYHERGLCNILNTL